MDFLPAEYTGCTFQEPNIHPDFCAILDAVKARPVHHVMINTNGVGITQDRAFVEKLARYAPRFEVYLQVKSLNDEALLDLRSAKLARIRQQALEALESVGFATTLAVARSALRVSVPGRFSSTMQAVLSPEGQGIAYNQMASLHLIDLSGN